MPMETNAQTIKTKSGKLGVFARRISDGDANYNAPARESPDAPPNQSETPLLPSSAPTREDMAKSARIPLPQVSRRAAPPQVVSSALIQPLPPSPKKPRQQSPQRPSNQPGHVVGRGLEPEPPKPLQALVSSQRDLFAGSQLGDDFMASGLTSGLTTPRVEFHEHHKQINAGETNPMPFHNQAEQYARDKLHWSKPDDRFRLPLMSNNGMFSAKVGTDHEPPVYMADGFQNGTSRPRNHYRAENDRAQSPIRRVAKLPIREEPRKTRGAPEGTKRNRVRSPSADYHDARRHRLREPDTQGPLGAQDNGDHIPPHNFRSQEVHETPKASKRNTSSMKRLLDSPIAVPEGSATLLPGRKRSRASPDYNDTILGTKTFSELQEEPFDLDPTKTVVLSGDGSDGDNLSKRLGKIQTQPEKDQKTYFGTMPLDEWEASGDWFVDQFSSLMNRFKDARKEKRRLVQDFETEAARREEAVRLRANAIDDKLVKMRQDGQRVVGSRML